MPVRTSTLPLVAAGEAYAREVVAGKVPACRWVQLACQRHLDDRERWKAKSAAYFFDAEAAERVIDIIQHFPHIKGVWAQNHGRIVLQPWQVFIVANVFGWKVRETGMRRFRIVYIEVGRKNAKSTLTSAVGNYLVACDEEQGAHVVSAASSMQQAKLVFADAQHMARREPGFRDRYGVEVLAHTIVQPSTASKFEALSAEYSNLDGLNLHAALIDELHAHPTRNLWDVLATATGSRAQPLLWAITTAGQNRASVCYDQRNHLINILAKRVADESYFGLIYTIDEGDDPFEETSWVKANPNYGVSIYPETLQQEAARARVMPSELNTFLTKHLDVWVNADHAWLPAGAWDKLADSALRIEDFEGQPCYIGIDLAERSDIAATVTLFPPFGERERWAAFGKYYLPRDKVARSENSHYQGWENAQLLTVTDGPATDFDYIVEDLLRWCENFQVLEIASDPYKNVSLVMSLRKRGLTLPILDVRQSVAVMSPAMKELEALVLDKKLAHDGDPILAWMIANVVCHRDEKDNLYPKKESLDKKIDGVLALLMALDRAMRSQQSGADPGIWSI